MPTEVPFSESALCLIERGGYRAEIGPKHPGYKGMARQPWEGVNLYQWSIHFPEGYKSQTHHMLIGQVHADGQGTNPIWSLQFDERVVRIRTNKHRFDEDEWVQRQFDYPLPESLIGEAETSWLRLALAISYESADGQLGGKGFWAFYANGAHLAGQPGRNGYANEAPDGNFFKAGIYLPGFKSRTADQLPEEHRHVVAVKDFYIQNVIDAEWAEKGSTLFV